MSRLFSSALRPAKLAKATRSLRKAMTGLVIKSTFAAIAPKAAKPRKAKTPKVGRTLGLVLQQMRVAKSLLPVTRLGSSTHIGAPRIPKGAQYLTRTHRSTAGSRHYKLYVPTGMSAAPKGLILMLHGCNQTPDDFAIGTHMNALAEKHQLVIAYPEQTGRDNAASCWNWFRPGDQARGGGEPAILASLARKLAKEFGLGRDAVFVAGLSAGGAMAAVLADVYPDVFAAAGVHSGLARGAARDVMSAMLAMRNGGGAAALAPRVASKSKPVRRIVFHGDADSTVHPTNAAMIVAAGVVEAATPVKVTKRSVGGRGYVRSDFAGTDSLGALELWMIDGAGHAWSGGRAAGSYTDAKGPDASAQMVRFFLNTPA